MALTDKYTKLAEEAAENAQEGTTDIIDKVGKDISGFNDSNTELLSHISEYTELYDRYLQSTKADATILKNKLKTRVNEIINSGYENVSSILNENSWEDIRLVIENGDAKKFWNIGDRKILSKEPLIYVEIVDMVPGRYRKTNSTRRTNVVFQLKGYTKNTSDTTNEAIIDLYDNLVELEKDYISKIISDGKKIISKNTEILPRFFVPSIKEILNIDYLPKFASGYSYSNEERISGFLSDIKKYNSGNNIYLNETQYQFYRNRELTNIRNIIKEGDSDNTYDIFCKYTPVSETVFKLTMKNNVLYIDHDSGGDEGFTIDSSNTWGINESTYKTNTLIDAENNIYIVELNSSFNHSISNNILTAGVKVPLFFAI